MANTIANLPPAVANVIQQGILERELMDFLKPALLWRDLFEKQLHPGRIGEIVTKTREGIIQPETKASALRTPGTDPGLVTRSVEQFSYQVRPYGKSIDISLPASYLANADRFLADTKALLFAAAQSASRMARDTLIAAYVGGNTYATSGTTSTALVVADATGFDTVMVNGTPVTVSASFVGTLNLAGVGSVTYNAVNLATNTITLTGSQTWANNAAVVRSDAPNVTRQNSRASIQALVLGDTPTFVTFRNAAAYLRGHNVPGMNGQPGGDYGCYIDSDTENTLFSDAEFRQAIAAVGNTGVYAEGVIGRYAGIQFLRMPKSEMGNVAQAGALQTPVHRSLMFGDGIGIEAFVPEQAFLAEVAGLQVPQAVVELNHFRMPIDLALALVVRGPLDAAGEVIRDSWLLNADWAIPTDSLALTGNQRVKRAVIVETAGPA